MKVKDSFLNHGQFHLGNGQNVRTFRLLTKGKCYIHKKERTQRLTFLQLATPSQLRRKGHFVSVCMDQSPHRNLKKYKKSGLHVRTKNEYL
jgi:hypothetical protein